MHQISIPILVRPHVSGRFLEEKPALNLISKCI